MSTIPATRTTTMHNHEPVDPAQPRDESGDVRALRVTARDIRPGDYLPPQRALHGTRFRDDGFVVGAGDRDVTQLAVLSGRMLVFGPHGTLDSLGVDTDVDVHRVVERCCA